MEQLQYRRLRWKIILTTVTVSLLPLLLSNAMLFYYYNFVYTKEILDHASELVERHKLSVDSFLGQHYRMISLLADSYSKNYLASDNHLRQRLDELRKLNSILDLGIVDEKGVQQLYAGPFDLRGADYSQAEWFKRSQAQPYCVSDVFTGLRGTPHFIVTATRQEDDRTWTYRATVDFAAFNTLVGNLRVGETGRAYIINRKGEYQINVHPTDGLSPGLREELATIRYPSRPLVLDRPADGEGGNIYVAAALDNSNWILVFKQRREDAFRHFYQAQAISITILSLGGLAILATAVFMARRTTERLAEADRDRQLMQTQVLEAGKLAAIGELAAGLAHEINNPVAIMMEEAGWIGDLTSEGENLQANLGDIRTAVRNIVTQGKRCREITHKLLSFARRTDSPTGRTDMNALIEELAGLSAQRTKLSNIRLVLELSPDFPRLEFSPSEMQQVILNLVNNAIDAIGETGGGEIDIRSFVENGRAIIEVRDNGQGIPASIAEKIFEPFFTTKPEGKGTGLGLPICRGIIRKLGGELSVTSQPGAGTTFRVDLPAPPPQEDVSASTTDTGPID